MFHGSYAALITPFDGGAIDERAFGDFIEWQISEGTHGLVPCGTTGESPTLSHPEHRRVTEICVEVTNGRVPVVAGTGSNSTEEAISLTRHAKASGADAVLVVTPYYNKPTQEGLYQHYKAINDAVDLPILIYNIPGRSVVDMTVETMARCARLSNVAGVKDASNSATRPLETRIACGEGFVQLSGEDAAVLALLVEGGHGCISVTANVAPRLCSEMHSHWMDGDPKATLAAQQRLMPLHDALFAETSPAPVKYAASVLGKCSPEVRLPLVEPTQATREKVRNAMRSTGLLN
ncbi:MAG: 4-hydroxy-tetrahydrodipicolinate synthase [Thiotrichales bacterium]|nr:4-hydroxy-tetrahydrodipicolinate synthase [Thiotrichales bacterium]